MKGKQKNEKNGIKKKKHHINFDHSIFIISICYKELFDKSFPSHVFNYSMSNLRIQIFTKLRNAEKYKSITYFLKQCIKN